LRADGGHDFPGTFFHGGKHAKDTSWEVSDAFWERVRLLLPRAGRQPGKKYLRKPGRSKALGCPESVRRHFYVLRTGCQWKALPKERFGSPSSVHAYFQRWEKAGVFLRIWQQGLAEYDEMEGVSWRGKA